MASVFNLSLAIILLACHIPTLVYVIPPFFSTSHSKLHNFGCWWYH